MNPNHRKTISLFVLAFGAAILRSRSVFAVNALVKARTIGELIVTILAGSGTAVTNQTVIPQIYTEYDTSVYSFESMIEEGILSIPGMTPEQAVEELGRHNPYNLDTQKFRTLLDSNWHVMTDNYIDAILRIRDIANTDPQYGAIDNLGQIVKDVAENGYLSLENFVAIVTNSDVSIRVGLENFADTLRYIFRGNIENGIPIDAIVDANTAFFYMMHNTQTNVRFALQIQKTEGVYFCGYLRAGRTPQVYCYNSNNSSRRIHYTITNLDTGFVQNLYTDVLANRIMSCVTYGPESEYMIYMSKPYYVSNTDTQTYNYLLGIQNGETPYVPKSPDIINQEYGNIAYDDETQPAINQGEGLQIIPSEDYNQFMDDINNSQNPQYNNDVMDEFINRYKQEAPIPTPTIIPPQPSLTPKPPITNEDIDVSLGGVTVGLEDIFPFCIPFDIKRIFEKLETSRQAPHIVYNMEYHGKSLGTIDIDLSTYDSIALLFRSLEVILYIFGLAMITRQLIGA